MGESAEPQHTIESAQKYLNNLEKKPTQCVKTLKAFNQYTGQCWSDATSVFLLFASKVGSFVQGAFLLRDEIRLKQLFNGWLTKNKSKVDTIAGFELSGEDYTQFIKLATDYMTCLHGRFKNYKTRISP